MQLVIAEKTVESFDLFFDKDIVKFDAYYYTNEIYYPAPGDKKIYRVSDGEEEDITTLPERGIFDLKIKDSGRLNIVLSTSRSRLGRGCLDKSGNGVR
jgi:hypothetical protein